MCIQLVEKAMVQTRWLFLIHLLAQVGLTLLEITHHHCKHTVFVSQVLL